VLEDVGFHFGTTKNEKPDWEVMNTALRTTEAKWQPLTDSGIWARHLSEQNLTKLSTNKVQTYCA
jgi:hypothetical protein